MASAEEAHVKLRYPIELLQNTLKCVICLEDYKDPVLTRCEHLFCWECISRILNDRRRSCCPLCKVAVSRRSITRVDYVSEMITRFIDLRDSIPKDTGFEIESFLGAPTGAKEAPTNSPASRKLRCRNPAETKITPQTPDVSEQSEVSTSGVKCTEENVFASEEVSATNVAPEKSIIVHEVSKFGKCYRRKSSEQQSKAARAAEDLGSDKDNVSLDSDDWDKLYMPKETIEKTCPNIAAAGDTDDSESLPSVRACEISDRSSASGEDASVRELATDAGGVADNSFCTKLVKPAESSSHFPFNYPARKVRDKTTSFEKLLKESSIASSQALSKESGVANSQALSEGWKDSHGKKIFTCRVQENGNVSSGNDGKEKRDDPYLFVSSQHTPHRVKYRKDGVKDLGKVGKPRARKNAITKTKQSNQETKDVTKKVVRVSLLEMGSQNFIESCPVEVNDEFDKLVVEVHKLAHQAQTNSKSVHEAVGSANDSEDANLACLFRTPSNEAQVPELPGENEASLVGKDRKQGRRRHSGSGKCFNLNSSGSAEVKRKSRRTKSSQHGASSGSNDQPSLSQQVRQIVQQFDDVSSHVLSVEQNEAAVKRDSNKNILDLNVMSSEYTDKRPLQKSSNGTKRVSFADIGSKEQAPNQDSCSVEKFPDEDLPVVISRKQSDGVGTNSNPESDSTNLSNEVCHVETAAGMPEAPKGRKHSGSNKNVAEISSCEITHLKPSITFDLVSEAGSSVSSPGEPVLGFVMSPAGEEREARWKVRTARNLEMVETSPGQKRKRVDADELDETLVAEATEERASFTTTVCGDLGVKALLDSGMSDNNVETLLHTPNKDSTALNLDLRVPIAAEGSSNEITEVPLKHIAKKMKQCESSDIVENRPQRSSCNSSRPSVQQEKCDQHTQTTNETVDAGTEVEQHLTSVPRAKTRTYVEVSVQTDTFEDTLQKRQVPTVDMQTSPIKINLERVEKSTSVNLQTCKGPENTEHVPGTCGETVKDGAYLAQNFKDLGAQLCSQDNALTEESEVIVFSSEEGLAVDTVMSDDVMHPSEVMNKLPQTSKANTETTVSRCKSKPDVMATKVNSHSFGEKNFQRDDGKPTPASTATITPGQSPKAGDKGDNSNKKGKGLLSLTSSKVLRKLSFSPNFVPTLSTKAFPMVLETDSSESDEEIGQKKAFKTVKKSRRLSLSSESDVEQEIKSSVDNVKSCVSNGSPASVTLESDGELAASRVMEVEALQATGGETSQHVTKPSSPARAPGALQAVDAARGPENPSALITPSLQALLETATSQENTMEFLEGGGMCEHTQRSAASTEPIDTQQLQKIDLAIMEANTELESPGNLQQRGKAAQAKDDASSVVDDHEMLYDDIIEPTPQKVTSFVSHWASKTKGDTSLSKSRQFADVPQSQATKAMPEVVVKLADSTADVCADAPQKVAPEGRKELLVGAQRAPLQVVTNALPVVTRSTADLPQEQKPLCIACSMLSAQSKFLVQKFAEFFGLSYSLTYHCDVTHLLVPSTEESIQSIKYVFAVAEKKWVLYEQWVRDCLKARRLLPEESYEVCEPVNGGPRRARLSTEPLFKNHQMCFIPPMETITSEQIQEVSEMCGAEVVAKPELLCPKPGRTILLLTEEKREDDALELLRRYRIPPISYYYVIDCISAYKLLDPFTYLITKKLSESAFRKLGYK